MEANAEQAITDRIHATLFPKQTQAAQQPREQGKFVSEAPPEAPPETPQEEPGVAPDGVGEPSTESAPVEPQEAAEDNAQVEGADAPVAWEDVKEVKIKVPFKDGSREWEEELSLEDLRLGRMRQEDYSRKTQEVARERAKAQDEVRQSVSQIRQQAVAELQTYEQTLFDVVAPQFHNVDMDRLSQEDPAQWARLRQLQENFNGKLYQIRTQRQQLEQAQSLEIQQSRAQAIAQANESLKAEIPNWGPDLDRALATMATNDYGFRTDELAQGYIPIADARVMKMAHDAYQWRQLQQQKPIATKKVTEAPKVLKPGVKREPGQDQIRRNEALREEVRKSGGKGQRGEQALAALIRDRLYGRKR